MPSVVISGYYGFDNWGDEAILEAAATGLAGAVPGVEITVLSHDPAATLARHGLHAVNRSDPAAVWRAIRRSDMLVSGGGSLLQDVTSTRSLWYYLGVILMAQHLGKKVMLYANGVGPINRRLNRSLARLVLDRVPLITVRGPSSERLLRELGVTAPRVVVTADSAFAIEPAPLERVAAICEAEGLPDIGDHRQGRVVGVAVRPWRGSRNIERVVARAADYISGKLGYRVLFLPVHRRVDLAAVEAVRAEMQQPSYLLQGSYSAADTVGLLSRLRWILSMRLHPLIFAAVGGVPAVGLVYDPKVHEFLAEAEQVSVGPVERTTLEDILLGITEVEKDYSNRVVRLGQVVARFRERARLNNTLAAELLNL
ncbi:MAG: polysaccharide pyruvyl transferase CsaB [Bacillota bacterium]|nr:MAG: polysaccharide pyruvyl transferase CsaB [Bacillota bacterium]